MSPLTCRRCRETPMLNGIVTIRNGRLDETSPLCTACIEAEMAEDEEKTARTDDRMDYGMFTILPSETWPQYLRRVFPQLADAMYVRETNTRDQEFFQLGVQMALADETYARQTARARRTPQQIVEEFLRGLPRPGEQDDEYQ